MPPNLVPQYNELFMQLGWILFFSMAFPAGALFTIIAGLIRISIELTGMSEYKKKNDPAPILDIGIWMDLLEFISKLGIVVCMYIIMFTSKELHNGTFSLPRRRQQVIASAHHLTCDRTVFRPSALTIFAHDHSHWAICVARV